MFLTRTDKARDELRPGRRSLSQRERAMLLMADGDRSPTDFGSLFGGPDEARRVAMHLMQEGYLERMQAKAKPAAASPAPALVPAPATITAGATATADSTSESDPVAFVAPAAPAPNAAVEAVPDTFDGKRSLASTRMYLFDLCERLFARRDAVLAESMREALRNARDRDSMLDVASRMLDEIESVAGDDRAAEVRSRIERLLPPL